jgi:glycosyltransferase involved in cell wall biosynthesis
MTELVSVIIPTYNRKDWITKAIDSVLAQTYRNFEIIVVDDGSTDNTEAILQHYKDKICLIRQGNSGGAVARNTGIKAAKGEWIAFLDSDDEWLPEKLAIQMGHICKRPDICAHITNVTFVPSNGEQISLFEVRNFPKPWSEHFIIERPLKYVINFQIATIPSLVARRDSLFDAGLFDPNLPKGHDRDLLFRLALVGPWGVSSIELVKCYRRNEPDVSITRQFRKSCMYKRETAVYRLQKILPSPRLVDDERRVIVRALSESLYDLGIEQFKQGYKKQGRQNFNRSLRVYLNVKSLMKFAITLLPARLFVLIVEIWHSRRGPGFHT